MQYRTGRKEWALQAEALGISLEAVAFLTDASYPSVYAYARGLRNPTSQWLDAVDRLVQHPDAIEAARRCYDEESVA